MMIEGMDDLQQTMKEATKALKQVDDQFEGVSFDPNDMGSVERAAQAMERIIDATLAEYPENSLVQAVGTELKQKFRELIVSKAR